MLVISRIGKLCLLMIVAVWITAAARGAAAYPFKINGRQPTSAAFVGLDDAERYHPAKRSPMLDAIGPPRLHLDPAEFARLRRLTKPLLRPAPKPGPEPSAGAHVGFLIIGRDGELVRRRCLLHEDTLRIDESDSNRSRVIPIGALETVVPTWRSVLTDRAEDSPATRAVPDMPRGTPVALEGPYVPSPITLDQRTVRERLKGPDVGAGSGDGRVLDEESFWVRLPAGEEPLRGSGLLVWISPTPQWPVPRPFWPALDELNMIAVGAHGAGNQRQVYERLQLALDAIETASTRWTIDPQRVYVTGFSGGGRSASMLWAGFPELLVGAIPIGGLSSWERVPAEGRGGLLPATLPRPTGERLGRLKQRRLSAVTGTEDFNEQETLDRIEHLTREGFHCRAVDVPGLDHSIPGPDVIGPELLWIDEPRRAALAEGAAEAEAMLARHIERFGEADAETRDAIESLVAITVAGPWSEPAWSAAGWLGYTAPE